MAKTGPKPKYKWKEWFGLKDHEQRLHKHKHFDCQPHTMSIRIREAAKQRGIRVSVYIIDNKVTITNLGRLQRAKNKK